MLPLTVLLVSLRRFVVMEILIRKALVSFMDEDSLITPSQFGFVAKKSTLLQLLKCVGDWMEAVNKDAQTEVVFVDFRKVFETSPM